MGLTDSEGIGARIRTARALRQMSQVQLAGEARLSLSYLEKIERGARVPSAGAVIALARALRTDVTTLNGQPDDTMDLNGVIPELRRVLLCYRSPAALDTAPRPLADLRADIERISRHRRSAEYAQLAPDLPALLTEVTHVALAAQGDARRDAFSLLAIGYRAANSLSHKLGFYDLSTCALERVEWAAEHSDDPLMVATARYLIAGAMLREGAITKGVQLLHGVERDLIALSTRRPRTAADTAVHGAVLLKLAILVARGHGSRDPEPYLAEADRLARAMGRDEVHYETTFGPAQVGIHRTAALIELDLQDEAVTLGESLVLPADLAPERSSHHHIDLASAQLATGNRAGALASLQTARHLAPQHTRHHPRVRETAGTLLRLERGNTESVAAMARWSGVPL
ncbi:helix-turn-helix domain-containing protein [Embleya sp. AB8]|uniref:helix-turn-helix domain-containing protein n=1 Tax=Embleya sp. AB8 TaxID=3156304 RepID=UPI003C76FE53